jgi:ornithine cyclodeaminase/alanine dehydrogenase-like protein (mu-crystallin family)
VGKLATDDIVQMLYYRRAGYFHEVPEPYADLGEIVAGIKSGRGSDKEKTMTINLGLGLEDIATALLVYNKAREKGIGVELNL